MKIQFPQITRQTTRQITNYPARNIPPEKRGADCFVKSSYTAPSFCGKPFNCMADFEKYKELTEEEKTKKYAPIDKECKLAAHYSVGEALLLKDYWDDIYGKDGYSFVSIGTSPAGLARVFEYLGNDVKFMPISKLGGKYARLEGIIGEENDLGNYISKEYSDYLDLIGLSKEGAEQAGKKNMVCDYGETERTLDKVVYYLVLTRGIPSKYLSCANIGTLSSRLAANDSGMLIDTLQYESVFLKSGKIGKYTNIPHLDYRETEKISGLIDGKQSGESKNFNFAVLFELEKRGLLECK